MKFRVCTTTYSNAMYYGLILKDYKLCQVHENGNIFTDIEIDSLEQLVELRYKLNEEIILTSDGGLEIYDNYRE